MCARCRARATASRVENTYGASVQTLPLDKLTRVDPAAYLKSLRLRKGDKAAALDALHAPLDNVLLTKPGLLVPVACDALRKLLRSKVSRNSIDSVDGLPDFQVNLTRQALEGVIGVDAVAKLWGLPRELDPTGAPARFTQVRCFARLYSPATRTRLAVHTDASDYTVNVALSGDVDVDGGRLVLFHSGKVHVCDRRPGDVLVHRWSLAHGVTEVTRGERASLIVFFYHRRAVE